MNIAKVIESVLLGIGFFLCLFVASLVLGFKKKNRTPHIIFAMFLFIVSVMFFTNLLHNTDTSVFLVLMSAFIDPFAFLLGPLLYLYIRSQVYKDRGVSLSDFIHFFPTFIIFLGYVYFFSFYNNDYSDFILTARESLEPLMYLIISVKVGYWIFYFSIALLLLRKHFQRIKNNCSSIENISLQWMQNLIISSLMLMIIYIFIHFTASIFNIFNPDTIEDITMVFSLVIIIFFSYRGIVQKEVFQFEDTVDPKYRTSPLDKVKIDHIASELEKFLKTEKLYLDETLTLQKLADEMKLGSHHLSQVINQKLEMNFFELINKYRIEHAASMLLSHECDGKTILEVAFDSGFSSKSTFNATFKKHNGITPYQFRKQKQSI